MSEQEGFKDPIHEEAQRMLNDVRVQRDKIELGIDTSAQQVDRHLIAERDYHVYMAKVNISDTPPSRFAEVAMQMNEILSGSYWVEKANYCGELDSYIINEIQNQSDEESRSERARAANWSDARTNCLKMPYPRPGNSS